MEKPPVREAGPLAWLRRNLFSDAANGLVTLVVGAVLGLAAWQGLRWSIETARWGVIATNLRVILWGRFPQEEVWRPEAATGLLVVLAGLTWVIWRRPAWNRLRRPVMILWLVSPVVLALLLRGFEAPTPRTVANNLGYYLFRPDLLPILGATWRGPLALLLVAAAASLTWDSVSGRAGRIVTIMPVPLLLGLKLH